MAKAVRKKKTEPRVYVGPTLPGLAHLTIFRGESFPAHVAEVIEKNPAVRGLIVPVSQLSEAVKAVSRKGHILNIYARELRKRG